MTRDATPDETRILTDLLTRLESAANDEFPLTIDDIRDAVLWAGFRLPEGFTIPEPEVPSAAGCAPDA